MLRPGVRPRELWAWAMFDFANSGYTTVVITAIYNAYFVAVIAGGTPWATFAWTAALSVSYALVLVAAPWLGAYADAGAGKKRLLFLMTAGCVLGTAGLATAGPDDLALALIFLTLSNFCFGSGENLIAAFLPELAREESIGRVSGLGWGLGYLGGMASLALCLVYIGWAQGQGLGASDFVPACLLITALFFAIAAAPTFMFLRDRALTGNALHAGCHRGCSADREWPEAGDAALGAAPHHVEPAAAFRRVLATAHHARHYRDMRRFMLCILFYQAGIQAVIALAAIYAQQAMGFSMVQTIQLIFVVNIMAAFGAPLLGYAQDRIGQVRALALTLIGWIAMTLLAWGAEGEMMFWLAAGIAGLCLGASQSGGRALVGLLAPAQRHGEFFGLWGLAVKLSSILGPLTYGLVTWLTAGDHRLAILVTGIYFVIGLAILGGVNVERGRRAAGTEFAR